MENNASYTSVTILEQEKEYKLSRMLAYCQKLWIEKRKSLLLIIGSYLGFWVLAGIMVGVAGGKPGDFMVGIYSFFALVASSFISSQMFYDITKKEGRISVLMTPASACDKFIPRLIVVTLGFIILAAAGYFVLEFSNMLSYFIFKGETVGMYNPFRIFSFQDGPINYSYVLFNLLQILLFYFLTTSIFIYGSVTWPKLSFLKTVFLMAIILIVLITFSVILVTYADDNDTTYRYTLSPYLVTYIYSGVMLLVACFITYRAYVNFKRKTLIQRY